MREDVGQEAAVCLKEILDRIELPPDDEIPDADQVDARQLKRWRIPHTEITITKIGDGLRQGEWLFSPDTVARATEFYRRVENRLPYKPGATEGFYDWFRSEPGWMIPASWIRSLPAWARTPVYRQALWQWVGLVAAVLTGLLVMVLTYRLGGRLARVGHGSNIVRYSLTLLFPIAAMLVPLMVKQFVANQLSVSGTVLAVTKFSADLLFLLAAIVVLVGAGNRVAEIVISSPRIHPKGIDAQLIRLVCRVVSLASAVVVFLEGGQYLGVPLSTLLAGAGVGGLALALAAQDTLKNLFGSMMIMLDKPFRVGERIVAKGYDGIVEEIGLRSTKMRLLTGHAVSIPNEEMARSDIENIGRRRHIRRNTNIGIPLDTPPDKVEQAVAIVRNIVAEHEGMEPDYPPRVYLNEFNRDSLNVRIIYWYHPPDYWDFLALSERINLRIMRDFKAEGIRVALPTTTTFVAQDGDQPLQLEIVDGNAAEPRTTQASRQPERG